MLASLPRVQQEQAERRLHQGHPNQTVNRRKHSRGGSTSNVSSLPTLWPFHPCHFLSVSSPPPPLLLSSCSFLLPSPSPPGPQGIQLFRPSPTLSLMETDKVCLVEWHLFVFVYILNLFEVLAITLQNLLSYTCYLWSELWGICTKNYIKWA